MPRSETQCPKCKTGFRVPVDASMAEVQCPHCQTVLKVKRKSQPANQTTAQQPASPPDNDDGDTYRLRMPEPDVPENDPDAEGSATGTGDEPWSDLDEADLSGAPLKSGRSGGPASKSRRKGKSPKKQAKERQEKLKQQMRLWTAGAGVFVFLCVAGIVFLLWDDSDAPGDGDFSMANVVGDFGRISSGNFVQVEEVPVDDSPQPLHLNRHIWVDARGATASGPIVDGTAGPWQAWEVRPPPEAPDIARLTHRPAAWNSTHYLSVEEVDVRDDPNDGVMWQLHDVQTSEKVGDQVWVGRGNYPAYNPIRTQVALSPGSQWVAGVDYSDATLVRLWTGDGGEVGTFHPLENERTIGLWFLTGDVVLTLNQTTLSGWSVPDRKQLWSIEQRRPGFVIPSVHGDWVAMGHDRSIDLIEVASGELRGQLNLGGVQYITDIAISPDESKLAATYMGGGGGSDSTSILTVWNLQDGTARQILGGLSRQSETERRYPHYHRMYWIADDWLATQPPDDVLRLDLKNVHGWAQTDTIRMRDLPNEPEAFPGPGNRLWSQVRGACFPIELKFDGVDQLADVQEEVEAQLRARPPMSTVAVEVDAGSEERSRAIGQSAAGQLRGAGIRVVEEGPRLRATFSLSASTDTLEYGSREISTPRVSVAWTYLDEQGNPQWTEGYGHSWKAEQSRFKKGFPDHMRSGEVIYRFEFPGNPKQDMFEEVMSNRWEVPQAAIERLKPPRPQMEFPESPVTIQMIHPTAEELLQKVE